MTAATTNRDVETKSATYIHLVVKDGITIYAGTLVAVEHSSGEAVKASDATGITVVGYANGMVIGDGEQRVRVETDAILMENDATNPVTVADTGKDCYVKDDSTVSSNGGVNSVVGGKVLEVAPEGVFVIQ